MAKKLPADAFDAYFALGPARSYSAVAEKYGVAKRTVTSLAAREDWQGRIAELEAKARQAADQKKLEGLQERTDRHLKAFRFIQAKAIEALKGMPIESAMDAVRAYGLSVREERVILGEPSDRTAISIEDTIKREYERWLVPRDDNGLEPGEEVNRA